MQSRTTTVCKSLKNKLGYIWTIVLITSLTLPIPVLADAGHSSSEVSGSFSDLMVVFLLLVLTSLFVLTETALLTVRRTRISQLVEENNRSAKMVENLLKEPTRMLATLQIGLTMVQLFSAGEAANRFAGPMSLWLAEIPGNNFFADLIRRYSHFLGFFIIICTVGLFTLIFGEIVPKSLAIRHCERIALVAIWPIRWFQTIMSPVVTIVTFLSNAAVKPFGGTTTFSANAVSEEEIKLMVEHSEEHGVIETEEKEMIHKVFEFSDTVVRKVMTPRGEFAAVSVDSNSDEILRVVAESGHSRIPVYQGDYEHIVGVIHVKDLLKTVADGRKKVSLRDLARPAYRIPENKRVDELLAEFKEKKTQIAFVFDEYGTAIGLVTVEDLLEEIVGEILDEYDIEEKLIFEQINDHTAIIDGRMPIEDFNDKMGNELPTDEADTLGGFLFGLLGHMPSEGESAEYLSNTFLVEKTLGNRIISVRVVKTQSQEPNAASPEESTPSQIEVEDRTSEDSKSQTVNDER